MLEFFRPIDDLKRLTIILAGSLLIAAFARGVCAELTFDLDFYPPGSEPDGVYEDAWPLKANEVVFADVYVSGVPEPGLISMGFILQHDRFRLQAVQGTEVFEVNWLHTEDSLKITQGQIEMTGFRLDSGLGGDNVKLGTVVLRAVSTGVSQLLLFSCPEGQDCFVLDDEEGTVLDAETFPLQARVHPGYPGDMNGDGMVDLADAILALKAVLGLESPFVNHTADIDGDGKVGLSEAAYVLQVTSGIR